MSLVRTNSRKTHDSPSEDATVVRNCQAPTHSCRNAPQFLLSLASIANVETGVAVIVPFESPSGASIDALVALVAADLERVNATILSRTGSDVTMIPEVANHL